MLFACRFVLVKIKKKMRRSRFTLLLVFLCDPTDDFLFLDSNSNSNFNSNSNPVPHRASLANDSKESRDYVNRLIGRNLSKYFNNDPPNKYWIPQ